MEIVLLVIAGVVIYYLYKTFQSYLQNPQNNNNNVNAETKKTEKVVIEQSISSYDRLRNSEYGLILRMLGQLSFADNNSCLLEKKMVEGIIEDMIEENKEVNEEDYLKIYESAKNDDINELANLFAEQTKGEYKKRLKVIEFMFALAYADYELSKEEEESIIDIAAFFEIENEDFNTIYEEFKEIYENERKNEKQLTKEEALKILELSDDYTENNLNENYSRLIKENKQNIVDIRNLNKKFNSNGGDQIRKINRSYIILNQLIKIKLMEDMTNNLAKTNQILNKTNVFVQNITQSLEKSSQENKKEENNKN